MKIMRPVVIIAIILVILVLLAGCGNRVPTRNTTAKPAWTTPKPTGGSGSGATTTIVPTTTSPFVEVPVTPTPSQTSTTSALVPSPPPANLSANLTVIDHKKLVFIYNRTAYTYSLETPPLLIDCTLTVPNITRKSVERDPTSVNGDRIVIHNYPDPTAYFEVTVKDLETDRVIARNGYGGQYEAFVSYNRKIWVRYPGDFYIEFSGNKVTADVKFLVPGDQ